jgi:hypothetical protein
MVTMKLPSEAWRITSAGDVGGAEHLSGGREVVVDRGLDRFGPETVGLQKYATSGASRESSLTDRAGGAHGRAQRCTTPFSLFRG